MVRGEGMGLRRKTVTSLVGLGIVRPASLSVGGERRGRWVGQMGDRKYFLLGLGKIISKCEIDLDRKNNLHRDS